MLTKRAINSCIQQLKGEVDQYQKARELRLNSRRPRLASWST
jgi:hypothetical protein